MSMKKTSWISHGITVFCTLFFVFSSFSIVDSKFGTQVSMLDVQAAERGMPMSIAPKNLERAPESFRLGLRAESREFPTEEMTKTEAWSKLQNKVAAYARRLELMDGQNRKRSLWTSRLSLTSIIGVLIFAVLDRRNRRNEPEEKAEIRKAGSDVV